MAKITVIVPAHNEEHWIDRCVQSVRDQTFVDWELLVVDDGSTDATGRILDRWANLDHRIQVFHRANGGWCASRNSGSYEFYLNMLDAQMKHHGAVVCSLNYRTCVEAPYPAAINDCHAAYQYLIDNVADLIGYPPTWFPIIGEMDSSRDATLNLIRKMHEANVFVDYHVWGGINHNSTVTGTGAALSDIMAAEDDRDIATAFAHDLSRPWTEQ